jgi:hypothetical protein
VVLLDELLSLFVQVQLCSAYIVAEVDGQNGAAQGRSSSKHAAAPSLLRRMFTSCGRAKHIFMKSESVAAVEFVDLQAGAARGEGGGGDRALHMMVRTLRATRDSSAVSAAAAMLLSPFFSSPPGAAPAPLCRREVMDAVNAVETLSALLVKSLKEDNTGHTYSFFPCALCSMLNMSMAINIYFEAVINTTSSQTSRLRLCKQSRWDADFASGEIHLLLLAVEESVVRVIRSNAEVIEATNSSFDPPSSLPRMLALELQRVSSI